MPQLRRTISFPLACISYKGIGLIDQRGGGLFFDEREYLDPLELLEFLGNRTTHT